jgi:hypothetical protein
MLIVRKNQVNNLIATVSMNKTLPNPYYLFSFQHIASKERISFIPEVITSNVRYDKFRFIEGGNVNLSGTPPEVWFGNYLGQYYYSIYEQVSSTNTDIRLAYNKLESGRAIVIVGDDTNDCFFEPYISNDEDFSNIIYVSEEEQYCISGDTTPECVASLTGECPTYIGKYSPNSLNYKNSGQTDTFLTSLDGCLVGQIAMDDSRFFMVDSCDNYYQYDYTITSGGCFNQTLVNTFTPSGITSASWTLSFYDENTLIIGDGLYSEASTGSTLYLYDIVTSGMTKWLDIPNNAYVGNVYYNTGNTQMILGYTSPSGGTGYYQLYSGDTNPQLMAQVPVTNPIYPENATIYFSGNTPIAVGDSAGQYVLDFQNETMTQLIDTVTELPINYIVFDPTNGYLNTIVSPVSCYDFDIEV